VLPINEQVLLPPEVASWREQAMTGVFFLSSIRMIPILYGSQTGTSRCVAELISSVIEHGYNPATIVELEKTLESACFRSFILEMDEFNLEKIFDTEFIIFVCSTHGDGSEPFNMSRLWMHISSPELPASLLAHLSFAVFGLGDSSYEKFNFCSKRLFNRLQMLGARAIIRRGCGDSQDKEGYLTDLRPWLQELSRFTRAYTPRGMEREDVRLPKTKYDACLVRSDLLTPAAHSQSILEVVLDVPEYRDFHPGDCLGFLPSNYNSSEFMHYNEIPGDLRLHGRTARELVEEQLDYNACPQQLFFHALCHFLGGKEYPAEVVEKIREIAEDYDLYYEYVIRPRRTIFEVLKDMKVKIDVWFASKALPTIYPRYFTATRKDGLYHITAALVEYKTNLRAPRKSICSEYLRSLAPGRRLGVLVGKSKLFFDADNLLFFCTGVGVSLPRACVHAFANKNIVVFYGFRFRGCDFLYEEEFSRPNVRIFTAASREDFCYIQDLYRKNNLEDIDDYLVFVSGSSRLSKEIRKMLEETYQREVAFQAETW
jgi:sulfite reductase alpha subunit-like flavoprotein